MLFRFALILSSQTFHSAFCEANGCVILSALNMTQMTRMTANPQTSVIWSHVRLSISFIISGIPVTHPLKKITNTITRI